MRTATTLLVGAVAVLASGCGFGDQGLAERRAALEETLEAYPLGGDPDQLTIEETIIKADPGYVTVGGDAPGPTTEVARDLRAVLADLGWEHHSNDGRGPGHRFEAAFRFTRDDAVLRVLITFDDRVSIQISKRNVGWS